MNSCPSCCTAWSAEQWAQGRLLLSTQLGGLLELLAHLLPRMVDRAGETGSKHREAGWVAQSCNVGPRGSRQASTMCQPSQLETGSIRQHEHPPRLRARASGAGSTGSRQPCSMARNSSLQHELEEWACELIEAMKATVLPGEEQLAANKGGRHGAMLQTPPVHCCCPPEMRHGMLSGTEAAALLTAAP